MNHTLNTKENKYDYKLYEGDILFFDKNRDKLKEKYLDKWVGVLDQKVVGVNDEVCPLLTDLENKDIDLRRVYIEHLSTSEDEWWILEEEE